jgi:hypothetical protein
MSVREVDHLLTHSKLIRLVASLKAFLDFLIRVGLQFFN